MRNDAHVTLTPPPSRWPKAADSPEGQRVLMDAAATMKHLESMQAQARWIGEFAKAMQAHPQGTLAALCGLLKALTPPAPSAVTETTAGTAPKPS